jgi:Restriction endonuclease
LGLELLVLRIILDLRLNPRGFRLRSKNTAYAEVDVAAEGDHLMFSRWTFQCKKIQQDNNVGLGDVAKEVGIAVYMKAHVIVMVSTGGFSSEALAYAREISQATPLQFLFLNGKVIRDYLENGPAALHNFVMSNATQVMLMKRAQPIDPEINK